MLRVCIALSFLSIAACISYPDLRTIDETRDAPVSPDGPAENIAFIQELGLDAGAERDAARDAATDRDVPPHPERDSGSRRGGTDDRDDEGEDDDDGSGNGNGNGKGKGKPPKKKD